MHKHFITDPSVVAQQAVVRTRENQVLKERIKKMPASEVDGRVAAIAARVTAAIDCTQCANCCKTLEPELSEIEIHRLRLYRQATFEEFEKRYLGYEPGRGVHYLKPVCTFLSESKCTAYEHRPGACREYPRLLPDLKFRWKRTMEDYAICPIVFNTIELLKAALPLENVTDR